jgi:hypothetical protein
MSRYLGPSVSVQQNALATPEHPVMRVLVEHPERTGLFRASVEVVVGREARGGRASQSAALEWVFPSRSRAGYKQVTHPSCRACDRWRSSMAKRNKNRRSFLARMRAFFKDSILVAKFLTALKACVFIVGPIALAIAAFARKWASDAGLLGADYPWASVVTTGSCWIEIAVSLSALTVVSVLGRWRTAALGAVTTYLLILSGYFVLLNAAPSIVTAASVRETHLVALGDVMLYAADSWKGTRRFKSLHVLAIALLVGAMVPHGPQSYLSSAPTAFVVLAAMAIAAVFWRELSWWERVAAVIYIVVLSARPFIYGTEEPLGAASAVFFVGLNAKWFVHYRIIRVLLRDADAASARDDLDDESTRRVSTTWRLGN